MHSFEFTVSNPLVWDGDVYTHLGSQYSLSGGSESEYGGNLDVQYVDALTSDSIVLAYEDEDSALKRAALDRVDGSVRWKDEPFSGGARAMNGVVVNEVGSGAVVALSELEGEELWRFDASNEIAEAGTTSVALADDRAYVQSEEKNKSIGYLWSLDIDTGDVEWEWQFDYGLGNPESQLMAQSPVVGNGVVFATRRYGSSEELPAVTALDTQTGEELWSYEGRDGFWPVVTDGVAFGHDTAYALDSGEELWTVERAAGEVGAGLVAADDVVIAGGVTDPSSFEGGSISAYSLSDGRQLWSKEFEPGAFHLAVAEDTLIAETFHGEVYFFR